MVHQSDGDNDATTTAGADEGWPPSFPHPLIDELIERLDDSEGLDHAGLAELLALVSREAQRMRSTVVRLSAEKLSAADREADQILEAAIEQAAAIRSLGVTALESRLDEADALSRGLRHAVRSELAASESAARLRSRTRLRPDDDSEVPR